MNRLCFAKKSKHEGTDLSRYAVSYSLIVFSQYVKKIQAVTGVYNFIINEKYDKTKLIVPYLTISVDM